MEENLEKGAKKVLIVDDEQAIIDVLVYNLKKEGYETLEATDGITAVNMALEEKPDLMLLDIMLPKLDGLSVCKRVKNYLNIPILMLTAKDAEIDKIVGLELGADDYITKPFGVREVVARVKANLRKVEATNESENNTHKNEDKKEVDFVAKKRDTLIYIQVSDNISDETTFEREYSPLLAIRDAYPKMVIARTHHETYDYQGVQVVDICRWLRCR